MTKAWLVGAMVAGVVGATACATGVEDPNEGANQASLVRLPKGALLPDIVEEPPRHLGVQNNQQGEWLRFSSTHWNKGVGPLQIRGANQVAPCDLMESGQLVHYDQCTHAMQEVLDSKGAIVYSQSAGVAVFHVEHNHWHQNDVADFVLRAGSLTGPIVSQATKITYCLIDYDKSDSAGKPGDRAYWDCNGDVQGISPGWGDEYHHSTSGQEISLLGLPPGIYYLTHLADPTNHWLESDDSNNGSWVKLRLDRQSNASVTVLQEHSDDCVCPAGVVDLLDKRCTGMACGNTANK
jgi:hypothetical protein